MERPSPVIQAYGHILAVFAQFPFTGMPDACWPLTKPCGFVGGFSAVKKVLKHFFEFAGTACTLGVRSAVPERKALRRKAFVSAVHAAARERNLRGRRPEALKGFLTGRISLMAHFPTDLTQSRQIGLNVGNYDPPHPQRGGSVWLESFFLYLATVPRKNGNFHCICKRIIYDTICNK
jgi:hypothetical protein